MFDNTCVKSNAKISWTTLWANLTLTNKTRDDENETEIMKREASVGIPATAFHVHHFTGGTSATLVRLKRRENRGTV